MPHEKVDGVPMSDAEEAQLERMKQRIAEGPKPVTFDHDNDPSFDHAYVETDHDPGDWDDESDDVDESDDDEDAEDGDGEFDDSDDPDYDDDGNLKSGVDHSASLDGLSNEKLQPMVDKIKAMKMKK